jgi:hypothetical protein
MYGALFTVVDLRARLQLLRHVHDHFLLLTVAHVQVESMNGVWRVEKNLSVSRAIGDAGVCDLLHLLLGLPAADSLFRVAFCVARRLCWRCALSCSFPG